MGQISNGKFDAVYSLLKAIFFYIDYYSISLLFLTLNKYYDF